MPKGLWLLFPALFATIVGSNWPARREFAPPPPIAQNGPPTLKPVYPANSLTDWLRCLPDADATSPAEFPLDFQPFCGFHLPKHPVASIEFQCPIFAATPAAILLPTTIIYDPSCTTEHEAIFVERRGPGLESGMIFEVYSNGEIRSLPRLSVDFEGSITGQPGRYVGDDETDTFEDSQFSLNTGSRVVKVIHRPGRVHLVKQVGPRPMWNRPSPAVFNSGYLFR